MGTCAVVICGAIGRKQVSFPEEKYINTIIIIKSFSLSIPLDYLFKDLRILFPLRNPSSQSLPTPLSQLFSRIDKWAAGSTGWAPRKKKGLHAHCPDTLFGGSRLGGSAVGSLKLGPRAQSPLN